VTALKYLQGYPSQLLAQIEPLVQAGTLGAWVAQRHPEPHDVRSDRALFDYVMALKNQHLRKSAPLSKVAYDNRLHVVHHTLGTHTQISRVQGSQLKAKHEIRIASTFKAAPAAFLKMIVVHELAHLKERDHNRAFYSLCEHMEPDYHQLEFDLRLWLTAQEALPATGPQTAPETN
jgi:UTP pyrophosphatase